MRQNLFFKKVTKLSNIILHVTIPIEIKRNVIGFFEWFVAFGRRWTKIKCCVFKKKETAT